MCLNAPKYGNGIEWVDRIGYEIQRTVMESSHKHPKPHGQSFNQKHSHIQFTIMNKQSLLEAQKNPEKYRDLVVRIAGYCACFVDLTPAQQAEIIARTESSV